MVLIGENEDALQCLLNELSSWCNTWRLKLNEIKTKVMHFRSNRIVITNNIFKYGENILSIVPNYKYLGIILDEHLNFNDCTQTLSDAAGRALGGIIAKFKTLKNVGYDTFTKLFNLGVRPVYEYAAGIWGFYKASAIDKVQNRAIRYFLGVHKFAPNAALTSEMGWIRPQSERYICMLRLWNRLLNQPDTAICKKIFQQDYYLCNGNWSAEFKKVCELLNIGDVYENMTMCDITAIKDTIKDKMLTDWRKEANKKPKLRTYITLKDNIEVEPYVKYGNNRQTRSLMAQKRCGILPIRIETGHFCNLPAENRLCEICNQNKVEDEFHFLMECPFYHHERQQMLANTNIGAQAGTKKENFKTLFQNHWRDVGVFLNAAWIKRHSKLFK